MAARPDPNDRKTAFVTGITGQQGRAVARHLLAMGWRVRGLTRSTGSKAARRLSGSGIELVSGELEDRARLTELMRGVDGVFGVTPMNPRGYSAERELRQGATVVEAAGAAGAPHLVFSTVSASHGATGVPHVDVKRALEDRISEVGVPATVVRPNIFMDNLVSDIAKVYWWVAPKVIGWDKALPWVAVDDIGAVAAEILLNPARWAGCTLEVMGDRRSFGEAIRLYRVAFGHDPRRLRIPLPLVRKLIGDELVTMFEWQRKEEFGTHSDELAATPIQFTSLGSFLRRAAEARAGTAVESVSRTG